MAGDGPIAARPSASIDREESLTDDLPIDELPAATETPLEVDVFVLDADNRMAPAQL
jgi:hypothetical protein